MTRRGCFRLLAAVVGLTHVPVRAEAVPIAIDVATNPSWRQQPTPLAPLDDERLRQVFLLCRRGTFTGTLTFGNVQ